LVEGIKYFNFSLRFVDLLSVCQYFFQYVIGGIKCLGGNGLKFKDLVENKVKNVLMMRRETECNDFNNFNDFNEVIGVIFHLGDLVFHLFK